MEKCIPGNLVGHGKILQEVRCHRALRRGKERHAQVSPMSLLCRVYRASVALHA
jgi:hypothetical protein